MGPGKPFACCALHFQDIVFVFSKVLVSENDPAVSFPAPNRLLTLGSASFWSVVNFTDVVKGVCFNHSWADFAIDVVFSWFQSLELLQ